MQRPASALDSRYRRGRVGLAIGLVGFVGAGFDLGTGAGGGVGVGVGCTPANAEGKPRTTASSVGSGVG